MEATSYWWIGWDKLPRLASDDDEHDTETLGVGGGKKSRDETRDGGTANNVLGKLGYQDGFRQSRSTWQIFLDNHNTHGSIIAALLREMSELSGKAMFECVESSVAFQPMLTTRKRASPTVVAKDGHPDIGKCGGRMDETTKRCPYGI